MTSAGGRLYFASEYALESEGEGFSFKPANVRLFSCDASDGTLTELSLSDVPMDWSPELFGEYLAAYDDGAAQARVYRVTDAALTPVCRVPYSGVARPNGFARRSLDDALLYVLDGSVWLAPDMDASRATRVALCGEANGRGLLLDDDTYAVVQGDSIRLFDLTVPLGEVNELVVDGDSWNDTVNRCFIAEHPGVAVVSDPGRTMEDTYADLMLSGKASGDVVALDDDRFRRVRDAGLIAPLTDPALVAEWEKLPAGLRDFLSVDGRAAAIPMDFYTYTDVMFLQENWEAVRGDMEDWPDTWLEYVNWLGAFSHSEAAERYAIGFDGFERIDLDVPAKFEMFTLWNMTRAFARCWTALGERVDFARAEFRECVEALGNVDWSAMRYGEDAVDGEDCRAITFVGCYDPLFSEDNWIAGCRTLKIRPDAPRISRASGCFAFMTAASTSRATAQEYLKTLVAVNRTAAEDSLSEAAAYDFTTDPALLADAAGMAYTADSVRRYRQAVGDVAFGLEGDNEDILAVRDVAARFASGKIDAQALIEALNRMYGD